MTQDRQIPIAKSGSALALSQMGPMFFNFIYTIYVVRVLSKPEYAVIAVLEIMFMPSSSEGLPVVGVQALAMGLAIIARRVGGFIDIVETGENGYLYSPDDVEGMQSGLRLFLNDKDSLLEARLRSRELAAKFNLVKIVKQYEYIFTLVRARQGEIH